MALPLKSRSEIARCLQCSWRGSAFTLALMAGAKPLKRPPRLGSSSQAKPLMRLGCGQISKTRCDAMAIDPPEGMMWNPYCKGTLISAPALQWQCKNIMEVWLGWNTTIKYAAGQPHWKDDPSYNWANETRKGKHRGKNPA